MATAQRAVRADHAAGAAAFRRRATRERSTGGDLFSTGDLLVIDDKTGKRVLELRHEAWKEPEKSVQVQYTPDGKTLVSLSWRQPRHGQRS